MNDDALKDVFAAAAEHAARKASEAIATTTITVEQILAASEPAPEVIRKFLFAKELHMLIAEGGLGKTTMLLHALVDYVLGGLVLGLFEAVEPRGRVLIVTSEDRLEQLLRILYRVLRAKNADPQWMAESASKIVAALHIFDCSGEVTALHEWDRERSCWVWSPFAHTLVEVTKSIGARIVVLDPVGMFFGGEENSNDYIQRFMKDLRAKVTDECETSVVAVHHIAKNIARDGTSDQHVGRGASALAGNARGVMHMQQLRDRTVTFKKRTWAAPASVTDEDLAEGRALVLYQHKYSATETWPGPVVLRREGFAFRAREMELQSASVQRATKTKRIDRDVLRFLAQQTLPYAKSDVLTRKAEIAEGEDGNPIGRNQIDESLTRLKDAGHIQVTAGPRNKIEITAATSPEALDAEEDRF